MRKRELNTVDLFCGAGGATTGLEMALGCLGYRHRGIAINHWRVAVDTMRQNHPDVDTKQMSIEEAVPADLVPDGVVDFLWASPSCTHHSRAKGGKPRDNQLRAQPELILTWLDQLFVKRLCVENVPEFVEWGPLGENKKPLKSKAGACFRAWVRSIEARNYKVEWRILNCADYGDATTRKRFFLQAVRRGCGRIVWPEPEYAENPEPDLWGNTPKKWRGIRECLDLSDFGTSIFNRKTPLSKNTLRRVAVGMKKYNGMDFLMDMLGIDGGDDSRVHPLTEPMPTQHGGGNRCAVVRPFLVRLNKNCSAESVDAPISTVTATGQHHALCQPLIIDHMKDGEAQSVDEPIGAQTTHDRYSVVQPFVMDYFGLKHDHEYHVKSIDKPIPALTTETHHYLCQPLVLGQQSGAEARPIDKPCPTIATAGAIRVATPIVLDMSRPGGHDSGHVGSAEAPIRTITSFDNMQVATPIIIAQRGGSDLPIDTPLPTVTTQCRIRVATPVIVDMSHPGDQNDECRVASGGEPLSTVTGRNNHAVVNLLQLPDGRYLDIRLRMLKPSELAAAHSFPKDYKLTGNRGEQVKQIGNSVPCMTAAAICKAALCA